MVERIISFREAINESLRQEMRRDETVILMGEDIVGGATLEYIEGKEHEAQGGAVGVTKGLVQEFGRQRVLDTPISESAFIGAAISAAVTGLRPVAELSFVDFFGVCMDQIFNQGAKLRYMFGGKAQVPVVIRAIIGAGFGMAGQHSDCHYSVFTHMPGLKTIVPSTPADAKGLLAGSIRDNDPVVFFEHIGLYFDEGPVPEGEYVLPLGVADLKRQGHDASIVAIGRMVKLSLEAAERLAEDGIEVDVIDPRTLSPLDEATILDSVKKTHRLIVVDEDNPRCSMATDIISLACTQAFDYLDAKPQAITAPHTPVPFSRPMESFYIPKVDTIVKAVKVATRKDHHFQKA